jgi:hypothetical protein
MAAIPSEINIGDEIEIPYPFVLEDFHGMEADGPTIRKSWRPGTRVEPVYPDDAEQVADGMGCQIMKVVGIYKAGKFPTRVFFTRSWVDPKGRSFGKHKLCIMTKDAFRRRCKGFIYEYRLMTEEEKAA